MKACWAEVKTRNGDGFPSAESQERKMLNKQDVKRMIADLFRTEAARCRLDVLAVLAPGKEEELFTRIPREVLDAVLQKADILHYI